MKFNKILVAIVVLAIMAACTKKKDDTGAPSTQASLTLHFDQQANGESFSLNKNYTLPNKEVVNFSLVQFYISGIQLLDDGSNVTDLGDNYLLINSNSQNVNVTKFDPQHVHMLQFNVGIDSITNHSDPTTYPASSVLSPQNPNMHWSWNSGYIFMKLEGTVDHDGDGVVDDNFEYHIGLDANLRQVSGMIHKDVYASDKLTVNIKIDYTQFLDGVDLSTELSAHGMDNPQLSKKIADNVPKAIIIE